MGLFSWIFSKPCKGEHNWMSTVSGGVTIVFCRDCGAGK